MHYTRTVISVGALRLLSILCAALFLAGVTALVPPDVYGFYILILSCAQVVVGSLLSWPNLGLLRHGREEYVVQGGMGVFLGARLALQGILLALLLPVAVLAAPLLAEWIGTGNRGIAGFLALSFLVMPLSDIGAVVAQATNRFLPFGTSVLLQRLLQVGAIGFIYAGAAPSWELLYLASLAGYAAAAAAAWMLLPRGVLKGFAVTGEGIRRLVSYSRLLPISIMAAYLITWMDTWFIRHFLDAAAVGRYAWAYSVTLLATTLLVPLSAVLGPKAIDLHLACDVRRQKTLSASSIAACLLLAALVPLGVGLVAVAGAVVPLGDYKNSLPSLLILCSAVVFQAGISLAEPRIYADERLVPRVVAISVIMASVNALLNMLLIPIYGIEGAAFATATAFGTGMLLQWELVGMRWILPIAAGIAGTVLAVLLTAVTPLNALTVGGVISAIALAVGRQSGLFADLAEVLPQRMAFLLVSGKPKAM